MDRPVILITSEMNRLHGEEIRYFYGDAVDVVISDKMPKATVNIGTIGHVDHGKASLSQAICKCLGSEGRRNKSDRKRNRKDRWR